MSEPDSGNERPGMDQSVAQPDGLSEVFADGFTEEMIGALLDDDNGKPEGGDKEPVAVQPVEQATEPPATEAAPEDGKYVVPLFGNDVELEGDQLVELAEAGAQLFQHRPQVEKAMTLLKAVNADPHLQAILQAYANGQSLPGVGPQQAPQPGTPEEAMAHIKAQVAQELLPQIVAEVERRYQPFVDNVNKFTEDYHQERAFAVFRADPDYEAVNQCMAVNVNDRLLKGQISHEQAAQIMGTLKSNPKFYGQWYPKFKEAVTRVRQERATTSQPVQPGRASDGTFVSRAPKLEGQAAGRGDAQAQSQQRVVHRALTGDPEAIGALI